MESSLKKFYNTAQKAHALPLSGRMGSTTDVSAYTDSASKAKRRRKTAIEMLREHGSTKSAFLLKVKHLSKIGGSYPETSSDHRRTIAQTFAACIQFSQEYIKTAKLHNRQNSSGWSVGINTRAEMLRDALVLARLPPIHSSEMQKRHIALRDQHAADERIQLEKIERQYKCSTTTAVLRRFQRARYGCVRH